MLGDRPIGFIARNVVRRENWQALRRMARVYPRFGENAWRYFTARGEYPYDCSVRTPMGVVSPRLWSSHDLLTVNEIFCRRDYAAGPDVRVVVDIGSNVGISALYFLTRNASARCYLYEPVPQNVERLRQNLAAFLPRWTLEQAAVWNREAEVEFGVEPSGRYGGIRAELPERIRVPCLSINDVLERVVEREGRVDILKLDTEGAEAETVASIRPEILDRIHTIYFETTERPVLHAERFDASFACDTGRLVNRSPPANEAIPDRSRSTPERGSAATQHRNLRSTGS